MVSSANLVFGWVVQTEHAMQAAALWKAVKGASQGLRMIIRRKEAEILHLIHEQLFQIYLQRVRGDPAWWCDCCADHDDVDDWCSACATRFCREEGMDKLFSLCPACLETRRVVHAHCEGCTDTLYEYRWLKPGFFMDFLKAFKLIETENVLVETMVIGIDMKVGQRPLSQTSVDRAGSGDSKIIFSRVSTFRSAVATNGDDDLEFVHGVVDADLFTSVSQEGKQKLARIGQLFGLEQVTTNATFLTRDTVGCDAKARQLQQSTGAPRWLITLADVLYH